MFLYSAIVRVKETDRLSGGSPAAASEDKARVGLCEWVRWTTVRLDWVGDPAPPPPPPIVPEPEVELACETSFRRIERRLMNDEFGRVLWLLDLLRIKFHFRFAATFDFGFDLRNASVRVRDEETRREQFN